MGTISSFMSDQFKHFNARETLDAAKGWTDLIDGGGEMFLAMGGAMSTAELGISLAKMIRSGKVHAICCTAANLDAPSYDDDCLALGVSFALVAERIGHLMQRTPPVQDRCNISGFDRLPKDDEVLLPTFRHVPGPALADKP